MILVVTAAIVERDGTFLLTRRPKGSHLEGCWEFPGGKCEEGETLASCLARELDEELGVGARIGDEVLATTYAYDDRTVELHFIRCEIAGEPVPQLGQEMRWVPKEKLRALELPPADADLVEILSSPRSPQRESTTKTQRRRER